jgi:hypothetical protein
MKDVSSLVHREKHIKDLRDPPAALHDSQQSTTERFVAPKGIHNCRRVHQLCSMGTSGHQR